eukprot:2331683-Lingulodinium_polyedra.AAC.1
MFPREREALYFCRAVWHLAPDAWGRLEYLDVSPNIRRVAGSHLAFTEDGEAALTGTMPWRAEHPPSLLEA